MRREYFKVKTIKNKVIESEKEFLERLMKEGKADYEIANILRCSEGTVSKLRYKCGLYRKKENKGICQYAPKDLLTPSEIKKAIIAGFNDGDGHIGISSVRRRRSSNPSYSLHVIFSQSRLDKIKILDSIIKHYGGFIYYYQKEHYFIHAQLRIGTWNSYKIIKDISPFLQVRKPQAELAIDFIENIKMKKEGFNCPGNKSTMNFICAQETFKQEMHFLNRTSDRKTIEDIRQERSFFIEKRSPIVT